MDVGIFAAFPFPSAQMNTEATLAMQSESPVIK